MANPYEEYEKRGFFTQPHTEFYCDGCDMAITDGDEYYKVGSERYCESCYDEYAADLKSDARRTAGE